MAEEFEVPDGQAGRVSARPGLSDDPALTGSPGLPDDPALTGLRWLRGTGAGLVPSPRTLSKHRPGRRMVIRAGDNPPTWLKLYHNDRGGRVAGRHRILGEMFTRGDIPFRVPRVIGYWPEANALALEHLPGTAISRPGVIPPAMSPTPVAGPAAREEASDDERLLRAATGAADALRALHGSRFEPGRSWGTDQECGIVLRSAGILSIVAKWSARRVHRLGRKLVSDLTAAAAGAKRAPLHRDFHPGQVLWSEADGIAVLDWDDAASGPALLDAGNFAAHLRLEAYRHPGNGSGWRNAEARFLDRYLEAPPDSVPEVHPFIAATLFRLAAIAIERRRDAAEAAWLIEEAGREALKSATSPR